MEKMLHQPLDRIDADDLYGIVILKVTSCMRPFVNVLASLVTLPSFG